jgi:hypothetical protein
VWGYRLDDWGFEYQQQLGIFFFTTTSRLALRCTQWVPAALSLGWSGQGMKLTTHLPLVPRSKNEWSYTSTFQYAFMVWCSVKKEAAQVQLYLFIHYKIKLWHTEKWFTNFFHCLRVHTKQSMPCSLGDHCIMVKSICDHNDACFWSLLSLGCQVLCGS